MEFLKIGDTKIKIVMSEDEMVEYGISPGGDGCAAASKHAVWRVLDRARCEVGFDPEGDKILVQFYPRAEGGCELFVTKLGILAQSCARTVARSERVTLLSRRERGYVFNSLSDLVCAARAVSRFCELPPKDAAVYTNGTLYVLLITEHPTRGENSEFSFIREFGDLLPPELTPYITEHFTPLHSSDAVSELLK